VMRSTTVFLSALVIAMAYYGCVADNIWRFFEWRFIPVIASFLAVIVSACFAPSLLRSLSKGPRLVTAAVLVAVFAAVFVLKTEVTGTNTDMRFNMSPWPVVTVFGLLMLGTVIASFHIGAGGALWVRSKRPGGLGIAAALLTALVLGGGAALLTGAPAPLVVSGIALAYAGVALLATPVDGLARSGVTRLAAGAIVAVFIVVSNSFAVSYQKTARDITAKTILVALEKYKSEHTGYPESMKDLVPDYLAEVPLPKIGLIQDFDDTFNYSKYSQEDYSLEFASVQWVQCAYSPPFEFAAYDPEEEEELEDDGEAEDWETDDRSDVAAAPTADQIEMQARLQEAGLNGAWSCATEPPKLW